jgi:hypothetical protein
MDRIVSPTGELVGGMDESGSIVGVAGATGSASVCSAKVVQNQHWQSQWHPKF